MSPSFIIATVDKIARVAWRPDARSIFGIGKKEIEQKNLQN